MPRGKKSEKSKKKDAITEDIRKDHEEFLKAFEKPTQIYRFIRARQLISPTFLHRTLLYMPERCSRTNAKRKSFKVDNIFLHALSQGHESFNDISQNKHEQLWIAILGFYDTPQTDKASKKKGKLPKRLEIEIIIQKSLYAKRKNSEIQHEITSQYLVSVPVNPKTNFKNGSNAYFNRKDGVIKIPNSVFVHDDDDHYATSFSLILKAREDHKDSESESDEESEYESDSDEDPERKRRKVEEEEDPAGISLKNLTTGPRKRKTRTPQVVNEDDDEEEEEDGDKRRTKRSIRKEEETNSNVITHPVREKLAYVKSYNSGNNSMLPILYETELVCFDCDKECKLTEGEYDIVLKDLKQNDRNNDSIESNLKRRAQWETFDSGKEINVYSALTEPSLKFHLKWHSKSKKQPESTSSLLLEDKTLKCEPKPNKKLFAQMQNDTIEYRKWKLNRFNSNGKNSDTNNHSSIDQNSENLSVVHYQFMYNNNTQMQTEARVDLFCPWCQLNCFTLYGLMKHLTLCHPRFLFSYSQQAKGAKIIVNINQCYDGSYTGNPQNMFNQPGLAFGYRCPVRRIPNSDVIVYRPQRTARPIGDLAEILEKENNESISMTQYRAGHRRLYFHSLSNLPIKPCQFDYDSEGEGDPDWLTTHMKQMIDEFTDVNEGEKAMMKMWNIHVMRNPCICDSEMEEMCKDFITKNLPMIVKHNLTKNLLLHIVCLVDFGVLKSSAVRNLMKFYRESEAEYKIKYSSHSSCMISDSKKVHVGVSPDFPEPDMLNRMDKLKSIIDMTDKNKEN